MGKYKSSGFYNILFKKEKPHSLRPLTVGIHSNIVYILMKVYSIYFYFAFFSDFVYVWHVTSTLASEILRGKSSLEYVTVLA